MIFVPLLQITTNNNDHFFIQNPSIMKKGIRYLFWFLAYFTEIIQKPHYCSFFVAIFSIFAENNPKQ